MIQRTISQLQRVRRLPMAGALVACLALAMFTPVLAQNETASAGTVTVLRLNVRSAPSMTGSVVDTLTQNDTVRILGTSDDGDWYKVRTAGVDGEGWIFADYVATGTPVGALVAATPTAEAAASAAPAASGASASVIPTTINVRSGPGTNYSIISSAQNATTLDIVGVSQDGSWYQVRVPALSDPGWVFATLTVLNGSLDGVPRVDAPPAPVAATPAPSTGGAPVAAPNTGTVFGYGITVNLWQGDKQGTANLVNQMGFGWVKQQVRWEYAEPAPGAINWQEMDDIVNSMSGNGINTMFSVVTSPPWTRPNKGGTGGPPEDFQQFANFVGAIAGRFCGRLQAIEVWNEQNLRREWEGFPLEPSSYMDLLKRSYNAIKGACPSMLVISGATTPAGYSDVAFDDVDYLRGMYQNGLKQYSDGIGIHPSGFANPPSVRFEDWESGNYDALSHVNHRSFYFRSTLEHSRRVMEEYGDTGKKLWPTEFGWGSTSSPFPGYEYEARIGEGTQAQWIVDAFNIMRDSGYVAVPMLWNLNYPRDTEMGAFAVAGRPAFDALRQMMGR